jgi:hypothetical protein
MAAASISILVLSLDAAGALATARGVTGAGAYPSAGAGIRGVTRTKADAAGDRVPIDVIGTALVESGGAVTKDAAQMIDATGRVLDKTSTNVVVGYALTAAAAAGTVVEVLLVGPTA